MPEAHDTHEVADTISEHRNRTAIWIGVLAMLLAITGLGGEDATKALVNENIHASDTYAFYQAKNVRQTATRLAAEQLEAELMMHQVSDEARQEIQKRIDRLKATAERYENEPVEGKKDLMAKAKGHEQHRDHAAAQDPYFDYANALFQIAIVLASVSIVAGSNTLFMVSGGLGMLATLLMLNGFFLFFDFF